MNYPFKKGDWVTIVESSCVCPDCVRMLGKAFRFCRAFTTVCTVRVERLEQAAKQVRAATPVEIFVAQVKETGRTSWEG